MLYVYLAKYAVPRQLGASRVWGTRATPPPPACPSSPCPLPARTVAAASSSLTPHLLPPWPRISAGLWDRELPAQSNPLLGVGVGAEGSSGDGEGGDSKGEAGGGEGGDGGGMGDCGGGMGPTVVEARATAAAGQATRQRCR